MHIQTLLYYLRTWTLVLIISFLSNGLFAQSEKELEQKYDELLSELFSTDENGGTALVSKKGEIIYHKAFGMANVELNVPMKVNHIFRIGSVTKQFTAVAILQLMEAGKLSLEDEITKFIPDYPTHGHHITVEHLLTHTSGIRSYTGMESFEEKSKLDLEPEELIDFFKNQPMDFAPGEDYRYNNSGFFLLGYIIEQVSGMSYPDYVEENFFKKLGMNNSYYGDFNRIMPSRASGYAKDEGNLVNAEYLSMKLPYAAGSLRSTVEDLLIWNKAIFSYKVVSEESLKRAWTSYKLNNGKPTGYGYGWSLGNVQGSPAIEHGGGINGFLSYAMYLPDQEVFVAVLSNCTCAYPGEHAAKMAAMAIGQAYEWEKINVAEKKLKIYEGIYESAHFGNRNIRLKDGVLYSRRGMDSKYELIPYEKDKFYIEGAMTTLTFIRDKKDNITKVVSTSRQQIIDWIKTDKPLPEMEEVDLSKLSLEKYEGVFELTPDFSIKVFEEENKLFAQATNQPKIQIHPETEWVFEVKEVNATLEFIPDDAGNVASLILHQGGQNMPGKKVE